MIAVSLRGSMGSLNQGKLISKKNAALELPLF